MPKGSPGIRNEQMERTHHLARQQRHRDTAGRDAEWLLLYEFDGLPCAEIGRRYRTTGHRVAKAVLRLQIERIRAGGDLGRVRR